MGGSMIKPFTLDEIAHHLEGQLLGSERSNKEITGISIDTRSLNEGELFIAIKGPHFDGHRYLAQAEQAGARAAVVERRIDDTSLPQILVKDTFQALGQLGSLNREQFQGVLLAVTGSCGKTSVKEMLAAILSEQSNVLSTRGNLNNGFGVPLTLFQIEAAHDAAVIELGTSSPGEINYIAKMARPAVAIITNAAEAHLADLKSVEGVAYEKGFILDSLGNNGIAVLNRDDAFFQQWFERTKTVAGRKIVSFGIDNPEADCYATNIKTADNGMKFDLHLNKQKRPISLAFWGQHQVANACCAAIAAAAVGIGLDIIVQGLENARPYQRRGLRYQLAPAEYKKCIVVFDETYNANPKATLAAVDLLADCSGDTVMVFGDMLDLGSASEERHKDVGSYARTQGVDYFVSFGEKARLASQEFGEKGRHFESKAALTSWIKALMKNDSEEKMSVLVKGSRGMEMLDVVRSLVGPEYEGER